MRSNENDALSVKRSNALRGTPYSVIEHLGEGGLTEIYEVQSVEGRRFAVKLLQRQYASSTQILERMRVDAEVPLRLHRKRTKPHPNVVQVLDFDVTPRGEPYIVMELLHGRSLHAEVSRRGALPPLEAIEYVSQALQGARALHRLGVVHRDLKPANLFLCRLPNATPIVKLIDFNYAKIPAPAAKALGIRPLSSPTDGFVGTQRWAAPEQCRRETVALVDHRADIYTLGLVLYTLLCGRLPFSDLSRRAELLRAHVLESVDTFSPVTARRIGSELTRILTIALAKDPAKRYPNAADFHSALSDFVSRYRARHSESGENKNVSSFTAKDHARMSAELELFPDRTAEIMARYGVKSESAWRTAERAFRELVAADPKLELKWKQERARHRRLLETLKGTR